MKIFATQYTLKYRCFEIAISGCKGVGGHCAGCHSPETWDFNIGTNYEEELPKVISKITEFSDLIDWVWIYGGEPLDQDTSDLSRLLGSLRHLNKPMMLLTSYDIAAVPDSIKALCDYIKTGRYDCKRLQESCFQTANNYQVQLASDNQKIIRMNNEN